MSQRWLGRPYNSIFYLKQTLHSFVVCVHNLILGLCDDCSIKDLPHRSASVLGVPLPITPATISAISAPGASTALNQIPTIISIAKPEPSPVNSLNVHLSLYVSQAHNNFVVFDLQENM